MAQTRETFEQINDLENDGSKRLPICFCLDTSGSMRANQSENRHLTGEIRYVDGRKRRVVIGGISALSELKRGLCHFFRKVRENPIASSAAEICIVTFDDYAKTIVDFCRLKHINDDIVEDLDTRDNTFIGKGLELSLDNISDCIERYREHGIDFYPPWLVVMSDGIPSDSKYEIDLITQRIADMCKSVNLVVIPIAIGNDANKKSLSKIAQGKPPETIYNVNFEELFNGINQSLNSAVQMVDDDVMVSVHNVSAAYDNNNGFYDMELDRNIEISQDAEEVLFFDEM